jgi:ATP-dependent Lon protease
MSTDNRLKELNKILVLYDQVMNESDEAKKNKNKNRKPNNRQQVRRHILQNQPNTISTLNKKANSKTTYNQTKLDEFMEDVSDDPIDDLTNDLDDKDCYQKCKLDTDESDNEDADESENEDTNEETNTECEDLGSDLDDLMDEVQDLEEERQFILRSMEEDNEDDLDFVDNRKHISEPTLEEKRNYYKNSNKNRKRKRNANDEDNQSHKLRRNRNDYEEDYQSSEYESDGEYEPDSDFMNDGSDSCSDNSYSDDEEARMDLQDVINQSHNKKKKKEENKNNKNNKKKVATRRYNLRSNKNRSPIVELEEAEELTLLESESEADQETEDIVIIAKKNDDNRSVVNLWQKELLRNEKSHQNIAAFLKNTIGHIRGLNKAYDNSEDGDNDNEKSGRKSPYQEKLYDDHCDLWYRDMNVDDIAKYKPIFNDMMTAIRNKLVNETDIMRSDLSIEEKCWMIEHLDIMRNMLPSEEKYQLKEKLHQKLNYYQPLTEQDVQTRDRLRELNKNSLTIELRILRSGHSDSYKANMFRVWESIKGLRESDEEYVKKRQQLEYALDMPTDIVETPLTNCGDKVKTNQFLAQLQKTLDKDLYGMKPVKQKILEVMAKYMANPNSKRKQMALVGPPGVGKTAIARSLAKVLNLPFEQISLGGMTDPSILKGHSVTYIGSTPGEIVMALKRMKHKNGILFFDEFDKIKDDKVANALLHVTDFTQNNQYHDTYLSNDYDIDLSNLFFVFAINDINQINPILLDRIQLIHVSGYKLKEKVMIGLKYMVPKYLKEYGMNEGDVVMNQDVMEYLVQKSCCSNDKGVRQLERNIETVIERVNTLRHSVLPDGSIGDLDLDYHIENFKLPFVMQKEHIDKLFYEYQKDGNNPPPMMYQ